MQKWEYLELDTWPSNWKINGERGEWPSPYQVGDYDRARNTLLARLGDEGWELVTSAPEGSYGNVGHMLYFKRPKA